MKRILSMCIISALLLTVRAGAVLEIRTYATNQKVVYDSNTGNYWYWNMPFFTNKTYNEQRTMITNLGIYAGIPSVWHMASGPEINTLFKVYPASEVGPMFAPTKLSPLQVKGRIEESFPSHHHIARVYYQPPWFYGDWTQEPMHDDAFDPAFGAWVMTNPSAPGIYRVKQGASGTTGQSWNNTEAFGTLQGALFVAAPGSAGWQQERTHRP